MDLEAKALNGEVEDREEAVPVLVVDEDVPMIVASQDHGEQPRYVNAALCCHADGYPEL